MTLDTNDPVFVSLLAAATWWRDYATNLRQGRDAFPITPYPPLYQYTPMPPPGHPRSSEPAPKERP